jgi:ring-1,2-phenylacetyl-CoA epoxidase subunit PaaE
MEFYELKITELCKETADCVSIALDIPDNLQSKFDFIPGQYLTFEATFNNKPIRRNYSICSHKSEPYLRVAVKEVKDGLFSSWANNEIAVGQQLRVAGPQGSFTYKPSDTKGGHYLAFAAGSGITPIMAIMKSILKEDSNSQFTLFYGNKNTQNVIFKEELEGLKNTYLDRLNIFHVLSREKTDSDLLSGRISGEKCPSFFKYLLRNEQFEQVFLCGPYEMTTSLKEVLPSCGIDEHKIKFELFYNPETDELREQRRKLKTENGEEHRIKVTLDGYTSEIRTKYDIPILDAAQEQGLELPFSCKGGVCATCKAKVLEGEIDMPINYALEKDEVKAGFVLACQTIPKSEYVHIDFDVN